jgi:hypothetical protein
VIVDFHMRCSFDDFPARQGHIRQGGQ